MTNERSAHFCSPCYVRCAPAQNEWREREEKGKEKWYVSERGKERKSARVRRVKDTLHRLRI